MVGMNISGRLLNAQEQWVAFKSREHNVTFKDMTNEDDYDTQATPKFKLV